jgi:hypothetical protein
VVGEDLICAPISFTPGGRLFLLPQDATHHGPNRASLTLRGVGRGVGDFVYILKSENINIV